MATILEEHERKTAIKTATYAAVSAKSPLVPFTIERRQPGVNDVLIDIFFCGICHSDIHQVRGEWGAQIFPMVPGHEIIGRVIEIGSEVTKWKIGDIADVGYFVDSCRQCRACRSGDEQFCERCASFTYNGYQQDGKTSTYGGYSNPDNRR